MKKKFGILTYTVITVAVIGALFVLFAPERRVAKAQMTLWRAVGYAPQVCFDHRKEDLKHPNTAYVIDSNRKGRKWEVTYLAKNDMGNYLEGTFMCTMDRAALFAEYTALDKSSDNLDRLDKEIKERCMELVSRLKDDLSDLKNDAYSIRGTVQSFRLKGVWLKPGIIDELESKYRVGNVGYVWSYFENKIEEVQKKCMQPVLPSQS